jgi:trans-aconitate methyltransferase
VISRNAMQFLPGWPAPLAGMRAALRPGGRLSFLVWGPMAENPYAALPLTVARQRGWLQPEEGITTPFALGDADQLSRDMTSAGFHEVEVERVRFEVPLDRDGALANRMRSPMFTSTADTLSAQDRSAYEQAMADALDRERDGDRVIARGLTLVASGTA